MSTQRRKPEPCTLLPPSEFGRFADKYKSAMVSLTGNTVILFINNVDTTFSDHDLKRLYIEGKDKLSQKQQKDFVHFRELISKGSILNDSQLFYLNCLAKKLLGEKQEYAIAEITVDEATFKRVRASFMAFVRIFNGNFNKDDVKLFFENFDSVPDLPQETVYQKLVKGANEFLAQNPKFSLDSDHFLAYLAKCIADRLYSCFYQQTGLKNPYKSFKYFCACCAASDSFVIERFFLNLNDIVFHFSVSKERLHISEALDAAYKKTVSPDSDIPSIATISGGLPGLGKTSR